MFAGKIAVSQRFLNAIREALGNTKSLSVSVLIDRNCHQNGHIFKFSAPVAAQTDSIHIDIWIPPTLQRMVTPFHNADIRLLVQFTDGRGDTLLPRKASVMSSARRTDTPTRHSSIRASSTLLSRRRYRSIIAVSKEILLCLGTLRVTSLEVVVRLRAVVAAAVALALLIAFVPGASLPCPPAAR